jgi:hypothetical protein
LVFRKCFDWSTPIWRFDRFVWIKQLDRYLYIESTVWSRSDDAAVSGRDRRSVMRFWFTWYDGMIQLFWLKANNTIMIPFDLGRRMQWRDYLIQFRWANNDVAVWLHSEDLMLWYFVNAMLWHFDWSQIIWQSGNAIALLNSVDWVIEWSPDPAVWLESENDAVS